MPTLVFESVLPCSPTKLWEFHASAEALAKLTPPDRKIQLLSEDLEVRQGAVHTMRVRQYGIWMLWVAKITTVEPPNRFCDVAEKSPFKKWEHCHEFLPHENGALLRDFVTYELPFGVLGRLVDWLFVRRSIENLFHYRHAKTREILG